MSGNSRLAQVLGVKAICGLCWWFLQSLTLAQSNATVTLAWDRNLEPNIAGYRLHVGTSSNNYTVTIEAGNATTATVSNLTPGIRYFFVVTAYNSNGLSSLASNEITFTPPPPPNQPPTVSLTSPAHGTTFTAPGTIILTATAADTNGSISRVEFYSGSTKLGEDAASPYAFTWPNVPVGGYSFTARAFDNQGASATSATAGVTVLPPPIVIAPGIGAIVWLPNSSVQFTVTGTAGRTYSVYSSSDLTTWTLLTSALNTTGTLVVTDPIPANVDKRFYRVSDGTTTTEPSGVTKLRIVGATATQSSVYSYLGLCLTNPVTYQGTLSSSGAAFLVDTQATWSDNQFNGVNGAFYVEIVSGPFAGLTTDILATEAATKKLVIDDDLSTLLNGGELYRIRRHRTIADVFGPNNEAGLKGGTSAGVSDEIRVFNPVTQTISIYYFKTGGTGGIGWRASTDGVTDVAGLKLYLDQGVIIRRRALGDIKLNLTGAVKIGPTVVPIGANSNLIANMYPAGLRTLGNSGLYSGNAVLGLAGGSSVSSADEVRIWSGTTFRKYYYKTSGSGGTGWRSSSSSSTNASSIEIPPGSSFYVVRKKGRPPFNWTAPQPF